MKRILSKQLALVLIIVMLLSSVGISEEEVNVLIEGSKVEAETIETQFEGDDIVSSIVDEPVIEESNDVDLPIEDDYIERLDNTQDGSVDGSGESNSDTDLGSKESDSDLDLGSVESDSDANLGSESITTDPAREIDGDQAVETGPKETKNEETEEQGSEGGSAIASIEGEDSGDEQSGETEPNENRIISSDDEYIIVSDATDEEVSENEFSFDGMNSEENVENVDYTDTTFAAEAYATFESQSGFVIRKYNGTWYWPLGYDGNGNQLGSITSYVGGRSSPTAGASTKHHGMDIYRPRGSGIFAPRGGTLYYMKKIFGTSIGWNSTANRLGLGDNWLVIDHGDGFYTAYGHLSALAGFIQNDSDGIVSVSEGQEIGQVGGGNAYPNEGVATGPHLHWEIAYYNGGTGHVDQYGYSMSGWGINGWEIVDSAPGSGQNYAEHSAPVPSNNITSINRTYRVKSTTTLGLNIRPAATTANTPLGTLSPGVTIVCTKRTNNQINGYYWLYGTTNTGITGWITENLDWIEEVQSTSASSNTSTANTSTTNTSTTTSSTTKKIASRTVTRSARYKAEVGLKCQLLLKGETAKSYKSSNKKILTVSSTGLVTIKAVGTAKITIKTNKRKYTLTIKTYDPTIPTKLSLSVPKTTIKTGGSITLTPVIPKGTNTTYTWKTSNKRVATVANGTVTFKKKGRVTITCIANRGKKKAKVTFKSKQ